MKRSRPSGRGGLRYPGKGSKADAWRGKPNRVPGSLANVSLPFGRDDVVRPGGGVARGWRGGEAVACRGRERARYGGRLRCWQDVAAGGRAEAWAALKTRAREA